VVLWLYALTAEPPPEPAGLAGAAGERPRAVPCGGLQAVVGAMAAPLTVSEAALEAHDAVVRRLAAAADPLLPVRFGQWVADEVELHRLLAPRAAALGAALAQVAGCHQITLRLLGREEAAGPPADPPPPAPEEAPAGPGTRYLLARRERSAPPPEMVPVLDRLAPLVRAQRLAPAPRPFAATAYHLVERRRTEGYLAALAAATAAGPALTWSGPWPPWAFAPELG